MSSSDGDTWRTYSCCAAEGLIRVQADVGDRVKVHSARLGVRPRCGEVLEVRGSEDAPTYWVLFDDGQRSLLSPGPGFLVEPAGEGAGR